MGKGRGGGNGTTGTGGTSGTGGGATEGGADFVAGAARHHDVEEDEGGARRPRKTGGERSGRQMGENCVDRGGGGWVEWEGCLAWMWRQRSPGKEFGNEAGRW